MSGADERNEPATPRKRRQAWKEGQIAYSRRLSLLLQHLLLVLFLGAFVQSAAIALTELARRALSLQDPPERLLAHALGVFIDVSWPFWALGAAGALAAGFTQTGFRPNLRRLAPRFDMRRKSRFFNPQALADALVMLPAALLLVFGALLLAWTRRESILHLHHADMAAFSSLLREFLWFQLAALAVLASVDVGFSFWRHARALRMSRREIREEYRQQEGDPALRAQRRSFFERLLFLPPEHQLIAQAKVVIVNPDHVAVAIGMDETREPCVLARAQGENAKRFKQLAHKTGVPVVQDPRLARALYKLQEEEPIPLELMEALAIIFVALGLDGAGPHSGPG